MDKKHLIPKIIHYCWFGGKAIPADLQRCIDSWSKLHGYTIMRWDETNCSFDENEFVKITSSKRMLGFIGDYYRLKAVYEYGGIYLDTDVFINQTFDSLLGQKCFLNFIFDCAVGTAIIGAEKGNPLIKGLLEMYDKSVFEENDEAPVFQWRDEKLVVSSIKKATSNYYYTYYILKHYPQFRLNNKYQDMEDFVIFPKEDFEIGRLNGKHYALHLCAGEWRDKEPDRRNLKSILKKLLMKNDVLFDKIRIIVRRRRYRKLNKSIPFYGCYIAQKKNKPIPEI